MVNRYQIRPYEDIIYKLCYASFLKQYYLEQNQIENDSEPDKLVDKAVEVNHASISSSKLSFDEKLRFRNVEQTLFNGPNFYLGSLFAAGE